MTFTPPPPPPPHTGGTGLSKNLNTLVIPDGWFGDFFQFLEQYHFTIDENSLTDVQVSVDPEMLGRIFENLLAEIDPESGETARRATGSFYTPREIVDTMATMSLLHYLHRKTALQSLDPEATWWIERQVRRIENPALKEKIKAKLDASSVQYACKIGIQPIATEIARLRCFLTLIVDENIDESQDNRGIEPLPNLEFKFLTADALVKLPEEVQGELFNANNQLEELRRLRHDYLQSYGESKENIRQKFGRIQHQIYGEQIEQGVALNVNSRAYLISAWQPAVYSNAEKRRRTGPSIHAVQLPNPRAHRRHLRPVL